MQKPFIGGITCCQQQRSLTSLLSGSLFALLLVVTLLRIYPAQAAAPFEVTFDTQYFGGALLKAESENLSDPSHATFTVTDGSQLWYSLEVQANPSSLSLAAADPAENLVGATFISVGLLPPVDIIPINADRTLFDHLNLAVKFTDAKQQLQVTLDPFDFKATALDALGLLLDYLGLEDPALQSGFLKPGQIARIIEAVQKFPELLQLVNDLISEGHAIANGGDITSKALTVAKDVFTLFSTDATRKKLAAILVLVVQGAIPDSSLLKTVLSYPIKVLLTIAKVEFFLAQYLLQVGVFRYDQKHLPTILLQSVADTAPTTPQPVQPIGPITEFPIQGKGTFGITVGPDGNLWFTGGMGVGYITPAGQVTEFALPTGVFGASSIAKGSDGNLWFIDNLGVGRVTPAGQVTEYPVPTANSMPQSITAGPDGTLWFTELNTNPAQIGRITTGGSITEFQLPSSGALPKQITAGPDGNLWFTDANGIGRFTPGGQFTEFPTHAPTALLTDQGITAGPDGNLWFTEYDLEVGFSQIGRITPAGRITMFPLLSDDTQAHAITAGPDGDLWFTEGFGNQIGRITPTGQFAEKPLPRQASDPGGIIAGPDGNLWFTEGSYPTIGRITP